MCVWEKARRSNKRHDETPSAPHSWCHVLPLTSPLLSAIARDACPPTARAFCTRSCWQSSPICSTGARRANIIPAADQRPASAKTECYGTPHAVYEAIAYHNRHSSFIIRHSTMIQLVWYRRDLRIADHAPLLRAARRGPV